MAFYSRGADSRNLFEGLEVSQREGWDRNLNQHNVVYLDMAGTIEAAGSASVVPELRKVLLAELRRGAATRAWRRSCATPSSSWRYRADFAG